MAKFKLRPELLTLFTEKKLIDSGTGLMRFTIPHKVNRISGEKAYQLSFNPSTHCLQTSNEYTATVLRKRVSPKIRTNGAWRLGDPSIPWFIELDDADPMPSVLVEGETEVFPRKNRKLIKQYVKETGAASPVAYDSITAATAMENARIHAKNKAVKG